MMERLLFLLLCCAVAAACDPEPQTTTDSDSAPQDFGVADMPRATPDANGALDLGTHDTGTPASEEDMRPSTPEDMASIEDMAPAPGPTRSLREQVCGDGPHEFVRTPRGDWEVVAEVGLLDGEEIPFTFLEGPVWSDRDGVLYFSDFNTNSALADDNLGAPSIIWKYDPVSGEVTNAFPEGSIRSNGLAIDAIGDILVADHGSRGIGKITADGNYTLLVGQFEGKPFNAPNDLVATSDGSIYFTDPSYNSGVDGRETPIGHEGVYRLTPTGEVELIASGLRRPNGITTSIDEKWLYVSFKDESKIYRYPLVDGVARAEDGEIFISGSPTDGITIDCSGHLYLAVPGKSLRVYDPDGVKVMDLSGRKPMTNLAFGGEGHDVIYMTEQKKLLRRPLTTPGMPY